MMDSGKTIQINHAAELPRSWFGVGLETIRKNVMNFIIHPYPVT